MSIIDARNTMTESWHELVHSAGESCHLTLDEELESYLVFLLMRHTADTELASSVMARRYLEGLQTSGHSGIQQLQQVGDQCLLFSGLFPRQSERRLVKVSYYVDMGRTAYSQLAVKLKQGYAQMYDQLARQFVMLMDILQAMRCLNANEQSHTRELIEIAQDCGSERAERLLSEQDIIVFPGKR